MANLFLATWLCLFPANFADAVTDEADLQEHEFETLAADCAADIHIETLKAVVRTESGYNPFSIGVVNGRLSRQPHSLEEALQAVKELDEKGFNYSIGLGQINKNNFAAFDEKAENLFEPCRNLQVSGSILKTCYESALTQSKAPQEALQLALSCYYSGNFSKGFQIEESGTSYVQQVIKNVNQDAKKIPTVPALEPVAGGDNMISRQPQEATIVLAPASTPAKPQHQGDHKLDWVIIPDSTMVAQAHIKPPAEVEPAQTAEPNPTKGESFKKEADFVKNNRLAPGDFVLILN